MKTNELEKDNNLYALIIASSKAEFGQPEVGLGVIAGADAQQLFPLLRISDVSYSNFIPSGIYTSCNAVVFVGNSTSYAG